MLHAALLAAALALPYDQQVQSAVAYAAAHPGTRCLDFNSIPPDDRLSAELACRFMLPHLSRELSLGGQRLAWIPDTLIASIELEGLGWSTKTWQSLASRYPYPHPPDPLILRADWLLYATSDSNQVDFDGKTFDPTSYDLLLFNGSTPKTKAQWLTGLGVTENIRLAQALIIPRHKSGVAKNTRLLRYDPGAGGALFQTFDSFTDTGDRDPFANLAGGPRFDAQEIIASSVKIDPVTQTRGAVQHFGLFDGKGNLVKVADTRAVDGGNFLGDQAIRYPGSCFVCHAAPFNASTENEVRDAVREGTEITTTNKRLSFSLEAFYLGSLAVPVERAAEDYTAFCQVQCGDTPKACHAAYAKTVGGYDAPVDLPRAAVELYTTPENLALALGWYAERIGQQAGNFARMSQLAHGRPISRRQWESGVYVQCQAAMATWRARN